MLKTCLNIAGFSFACDAENANIQRIKQRRFGYFSYSIKQDSKMRDRFEQQMTLGTIPIGEMRAPYVAPILKRSIQSARQLLHGKFQTGIPG